VELFCGIGGCAAALGPDSHVVAAVDINVLALEAYAAGFPHPTLGRSVESLTAGELEAMETDLWWLSPPCQPYTRRGKGGDLDDPRSAGLLHVIEVLEVVRPPWLAVENVPEFGGSRSCRLLVKTLERCGYWVEMLELCPTSLGIPNRRRRFYLLAGRGRDSRPRRPAKQASLPLRSFLDTEPEPELWVEPGLVERYTQAIDLVSPDDPTSVASTFTSAYGRSPVRSGSYLATPRGARRFSPAEILRLLGFPPSFRLPADWSLSRKWRLVGNSLSVPAVRHVLSAIPHLTTEAAAVPAGAGG
jgi:DNA (cytosine-5)-methyltransferase 1